MSTPGRSRQASAPNSRRVSRAASVSTISSSDSDNQSHVTVDDQAYYVLRAHARALTGRRAQAPLVHSETAQLAVNGEGIVSGKRTTYMPYPNRLSNDQLERITGRSYGKSNVLRFRNYPSLEGEPPETSRIRELQFFDDERGALGKQSQKRLKSGKRALASNLGLRPFSGDIYTLRSTLTGHRAGSDIYSAGNCSDRVLEEHVNDLSSMVFRAEPGALQMPLKQSQDFSNHPRPPYAANSWGYYCFERPPGKMNHQLTSDKKATPQSASPATARTPSAFVQQKIRRAHTKPIASIEKPRSGHSVQYETLWTTPEDAE